MSDAISDALAEIIGGQSDNDAGRAIGVARTTILRLRSGRYIPSPETVDRIASIATPEQAARLRLAVTLATIRIPHPESRYPDAAGLAAVVAGEADPVTQVQPDAAVCREALRLMVSAARVAAATAPREHRRRVVVLTHRLAAIVPHLEVVDG